MIHFYKYQGSGNDFVIVDDRNLHFPIDNKLIKKICDRRFGVGADGLILLQNHADYDFKMVYFNADGNESSMCGNGGRCIVAFAKMLGIIENKTLFLAIDGEHEAEINESEVSLKMSDVNHIEKGDSYFYMNTGSPHYVEFNTDVSQFDLISSAKKIRYNERFKAEGTNVNYVTVKNAGIKVRTYERGVEGETLSCGTGVTACAIATFLKFGGNNNINIETEGGQLNVKFEQIGEVIKNVWLTGPAKMVFEGDYEL